MAKTAVKVYSTQACPYCVKAKDFLKEHKIAFEDIDVSKNIKAAAEMVSKSGQMGVPVIEIGDKVIKGFDVEEMKKALKMVRNRKVSAMPESKAFPSIKK